MSGTAPLLIPHSASQYLAILLNVVLLMLLSLRGMDLGKCEVQKMLILIQFHKLTGKVGAYLGSHTTSYLG